MSKWDGADRRKQIVSQMNQDDRDRFIRMDTNLDNLTILMTKHVDADNKAFKKQSDDIEWLKKVSYVGIGGLCALNIILKFLTK